MHLRMVSTPGRISEDVPETPETSSRDYSGSYHKCRGESSFDRTNSILYNGF